MARGSRSYRFAHFGRGYNNADGVFGLAEGYEDDPQQRGAECRRVLNVVSAHRGNISKRNGCALLAHDASRTYKDLSVVGAGASSFAVCSSTAGGLYGISSGFVITQLVAGGALSTTAPWTFLRLPVIGAQGPAFGMNGTDTPRETDGTGAGTGNWTAVSGSLPNGTLLEYHETTLWVAGVAANPYSLYWSGLGDPTAWPAANVTKFNPDDGLPLTALRSHGPNLLVFKERGIWAVYNEETSANRKFADNVGTLSPKTVVASPVGCFFLDPQVGVHLTDGANTRRISAQIQPLLDQIADPDLPRASATYVNGHYYLTAIFNGVKQTLDYDVQLDSWWVHSPQLAAVSAWDRGADLDPVGLVDGTGDIWQLFKPGTLNDPTGIFESYWSGPFHALGTPHLRKRCNEVHVDARGKVDIYLATDYDVTAGTREGGQDFSAGDGGTYGGSGTFGGLTGTFGGGGQVGEGWIYTPGVGRSWSVTFYSAYADAWEVDAYTMSMTTRRD